MQQVIAVFLMCCFLFNTVSPGFAATDCSQDPSCAQWYDSNWVNRRANHYQNHKASSKQREAAIIASHQALSHIQTLVRNKRITEAEALADAYASLGSALKLPVFPDCVSRQTGDLIRCPEGGAARKEISKQMRGNNPSQKGNSQQGHGSADEEPIGFSYAGGPTLNFLYGSDKGDKEWTETVQRLLAMDKVALNDAITSMAASGSADPDDPNYIPPIVLDTAFLALAQKITPQEKGYIVKYWRQGVLQFVEDKDLQPDVQSAAEKALFGFAEKNPQAIEKKFSFTDGDYNDLKTAYIAGSFVLVSMAAASKAIGYLANGTASAAEMLLDPATEYVIKAAPRIVSPIGKTLDLSKSFGGAGKTISTPRALESIGKTTQEMRSITTTVSKGSRTAQVASRGGFIGVVVGAAVLVYMAVDDALAPLYAEALSIAKQDYWKDTFAAAKEIAGDMYDISADIFDAIIDTATINWAWSMRLLGVGRGGGGRNGSSQGRSKKDRTCTYRAVPQTDDWNLRNLDQYINGGDTKKKYLIFQCLGNTYCPKAVQAQKAFFSKCNNILLKNVSLTDVACAGELDQLLEVNKVASSFYALDTGEKLFTRAFYFGKWIPEAEVAIRYTDAVQDLPKIFIQSMWDTVKDLLAGKITNASLGNGRSLRRGKHEIDTKYRWDQQQGRFVKDDMASNFFQHFHYEEILTYPQNNPYICNHSIFYQP